MQLYRYVLLLLGMSSINFAMEKNTLEFNLKAAKPWNPYVLVFRKMVKEQAPEATETFCKYCRKNFAKPRYLKGHYNTIGHKEKVKARQAKEAQIRARNNMLEVLAHDIQFFKQPIEQQPSLELSGSASNISSFPLPRQDKSCEEDTLYKNLQELEDILLSLPEGDYQ